MVTAGRELREASLAFRENKLPELLSWADYLSPLHQRLFFIELYEALSRAEILGPTEAIVRELAELLDSWHATAEIDSEGKLAEHLRRPPSEKRYERWAPPGG